MQVTVFEYKKIKKKQQYYLFLLALSNLTHVKIQIEIPKATQIKEYDSMDKFEKILPANNIATPNKDNKINFVFFKQNTSNH